MSKSQTKTQKHTRRKNTGRHPHKTRRYTLICRAAPARREHGPGGAGGAAPHTIGVAPHTVALRDDMVPHHTRSHTHTATEIIKIHIELHNMSFGFYLWFFLFVIKHFGH